MTDQNFDLLSLCEMNVFLKVGCGPAVENRFFVDSPKPE